jgi:septum formation protein
MLAELSRATHLVVSGLCLLGEGFAVVEHAITEVEFRSLTALDVDTYLASGEWEGRAGGYAIQGLGARLVASIRGDYLNVVGLPAALLVEQLETHAPELLELRPR